MEIIAHRGSTTDEIKENTLPAFERAKTLDADGIETDVRLTKDNKIVINLYYILNIFNIYKYENLLREPI